MDRALNRDAPGRQMRAGWFTTVTRHPRSGREIRAFGGRALFGGKVVLDIGAGGGRLALDVATIARRVMGVDPNEDAVAFARARAAARGMENVTFEAGDARSLHVGRRRYDVAIFSWSL